MSSIFGLLRLDDEDAVLSDVERMGASMSYRSPDRRTAKVIGPIGLGAGLMRVTHEDWNDAQPLADASGAVTLAADVRLDNREALAARLDISESRLAGMADSAIVLAAYLRWGEDLADHLLGDFAFAVWDGRSRKLLLFRDHMGQRTLFYTQTAKVFAFATDINALWALEGVSTKISETAIGRRLMQAPDGAPGATFYEEVFGLTGGMRLSIGRSQSLALHRYWRPRADPVHEGRDEAYYAATYRTLLAEAVACRLRRNRKTTALMLSGGYDSAAIAGLARDVVEPQGRKLVAVASVLEEGREDERLNARRWVEVCRRHMSHLDVRYFVRRTETVIDRLDQSAGVTNVPSSETHFIRGALYDLAAASGAQVMMDGHGGDYTVNPRGFGALAYLLRTGRWLQTPHHARQEARRRSLSIGTVIAEALRHAEPASLTSFRRRLRRGRRPPWADYMIAGPFARRLFESGRLAETSMRDRPRERWRMRERLLEILERQAGAASAAVPVSPASRGLEFTMPFHDKRIVEFGLAIPERLYAKGGRDRYLAHLALGDILPPAFKTRRWGGNDTLDPDVDSMIDSIGGELCAAVDSMAQDESLAGYLDFAKIRQGLSAGHENGRVAHSRALRALLLGYYLRWADRRNRP